MNIVRDSVLQKCRPSGRSVALAESNLPIQHVEVYGKSRLSWSHLGLWLEDALWWFSCLGFYVGWFASSSSLAWLQPVIVPARRLRPEIFLVWVFLWSEGLYQTGSASNSWGSTPGRQPLSVLQPSDPLHGISRVCAQRSPPGIQSISLYPYQMLPYTMVLVCSSQRKRSSQYCFAPCSLTIALSELLGSSVPASWSSSTSYPFPVGDSTLAEVGRVLRRPNPQGHPLEVSGWLVSSEWGTLLKEYHAVLHQTQCREVFKRSIATEDC